MFVIVSVIAFVAILAVIIAKAAKSVPAGTDKPVHKKDCGCDGNCNCKPKETMAYPLVVDPSVSPVPMYTEVAIEPEVKDEVIVEPVAAPEEPKVEEPKAEEPKVEEPKAEEPKKKPAKKPAAKKPSKKGKGKGKK